MHSFRLPPRSPTGWYRLLIESNNFSTTIPLPVTGGFNDKSCHDRSVGRIFTVDVQPPKVEPEFIKSVACEISFQCLGQSGLQEI